MADFIISFCGAVFINKTKKKGILRTSHLPAGFTESLQQFLFFYLPDRTRRVTTSYAPWVITTDVSHLL
jgi:hypothetical protein